MAHVLAILPMKFRVSKRVQTLSCMKNEAKDMQQKINCAAIVKQQPKTDIFERNNNKIKQSSDTEIIM